MWVVADYEMVGLFSLKMSTATGSGAKSLLVPTPYALKMALLDAACRTRGTEQARSAWPAIRDAQVAMGLPEKALVTNLFAKVLKPRRSASEAGSADAGPFQRTIAFREYVYHVGSLGIAIDISGEAASQIAALLAQISYLGKRGGFVQLLKPAMTMEALPEGFVCVSVEPTEFSVQGVMQILDDCGPSLTFDRASIYSGESVKLGKDRLLRHVVLPYRMVRSSKSYTLYELVASGA